MSHNKKVCTKCNIEKEFSEFSKNKNFKPITICKNCKNTYAVIYRKSNKDKIKQYRVTNKDKQINYRSKYNSKVENKIKKRIYMRNYQKNRLRTDLSYKLKRNLRRRLTNALKYTSWKKNTKFSQYIGCPLVELKLHIENKFKEGMTWENQGQWHIDHIIPLSSAKTEDDLYKLCHYTNLQPLWAIDNIKKGSKYEAES